MMSRPTRPHFEAGSGDSLSVLSPHYPLPVELHIPDTTGKPQLHREQQSSASQPQSTPWSSALLLSSLARDTHSTDPSGPVPELSAFYTQENGSCLESIPTVLQISQRVPLEKQSAGKLKCCSERLAGLHLNFSKNALRSMFGSKKPFQV